LLAGGISFYRFAIAPIALSAAVAVCALALGEYVLPSSARRADYLLKTYIKSTNPTREIPMAWSRPDLGLTYAIRKYNPVTRSGKEVMITKRVGATITEKVEADSVFWDALRGIWTLEQATVIEVEKDSEQRRQFGRMTAPVYETPGALEAGRRSADEKSFAELYSELTGLARSGLVYPDKWVDLHAKLAVPLTNFIIFFLAMPFALRVKRGGLAMSFGISIGISIAYMSLFEVGQALGRAQYLVPWVAAWAPNMLFFGVGLYLTSKIET
jgi:lipopolysaccharide export LptBFGC system permease protein LptF